MRGDRRACGRRGRRPQRRSGVSARPRGGGPELRQPRRRRDRGTDLDGVLAGGGLRAASMLVAWLASPPLAESRYRPVPGAGTTSGALTSLSRPVFVPILPRRGDRHCRGPGRARLRRGWCPIDGRLAGRLAMQECGGARSRAPAMTWAARRHVVSTPAGTGRMGRKQSSAFVQLEATHSLGA